MERTISAARVATLLGSALDQTPVYLGLAHGLRMLISEGRITPGTRLPSERELTVPLGISRTTVTRAYAHLRDRGYLLSRRGSGSVAHLPVARDGRRDTLLSPGGFPGDGIDLTCAASPAPPGVATAFESAVEQLPSFLTGTGYFPSGLPALREAVADRYGERGLATSPEQIVITSGALSAIAVATRALAGVGDRALVESPTYPNVIATLRRAGARLVAVGVDPTGWDVDGILTAVRQVSPRLAYLIPDFHNPTGALMADEQRGRVAHALERGRTVAVVDECLAEVAVDEVDMPAPFGAHAADAVLVGSASKAFWGGLRVGWLRAPDARVGALMTSRLSLDLGAPVLEQLALTHLMRQREQVAAARREQLRASRAALVSALRERLPEWRFAEPLGGLALWCELPAQLSSALVVAAERQHVLLAPGASFAPEGGLESFLRLPYTRAPEELDEAVSRLVVAWEDASLRRPAAAGRSPLVA